MEFLTPKTYKGNGFVRRTEKINEIKKLKILKTLNLIFGREGESGSTKS